MSVMDPQAYIGSFRHEHESNAEWELRKSFIEAHVDSFDQDRLECLSSCFINVEMYGCQYPVPVMAQLKQLTTSNSEVKDRVSERREKIKERTEVKFVKSSDSSEASTSRSHEGMIKFVRATDGYNSIDNVEKDVVYTPPPETTLRKSTRKTKQNPQNEMAADADMDETPKKGKTKVQEKAEIAVQNNGQKKAKKVIETRLDEAEEEDKSETAFTKKKLKTNKQVAEVKKKAVETQQTVNEPSGQGKGKRALKQEETQDRVQNQPASKKKKKSEQEEIAESVEITPASKKKKKLKEEDIDDSVENPPVSMKKRKVKQEPAQDNVEDPPAIKKKKKSKPEDLPDIAESAPGCKTQIKSADSDDEPLAVLSKKKPLKSILKRAEEQVAIKKATSNIPKSDDAASVGSATSKDDNIATKKTKGKAKKQTGKNTAIPDDHNDDVDVTNADDKLRPLYELGSKFRSLMSASSNRDIATILNTASQANHIALEVAYTKLPSEQFEATIKAFHIHLGSGVGPNKKKAKESALECVASVLVKPYLKLEKNEAGTVVVSSSTTTMQTGIAKQEFVQLGQSTASNVKTLARANVRPNVSMHNTANAKGPFLWQPEGMACDNPGSCSMILHNSCQMNKQIINHNFFSSIGKAVCVVVIDGQEIAHGEGPNQAEAKQNANYKALMKLKERQWTVCFRPPKPKDDISRQTLLSQRSAGDPVVRPADINTPIPDSNIGSKLLKMMGWQGGGLAPNGIAEPVSMNAVINRQGLGMLSVSNTFLDNIHRILREFIKTGCPGTLTFSPDFSGTERAGIHKEACRLKLQSKSYGKGDERFLTIRSKMSGDELVRHIIEQGGETDTHVLIPPMGNKH